MRYRCLTSDDVDYFAQYGFVKVPAALDRENPEETSPVELAVLRGLGVERLEYQLAGERREHVPERIRRQREMLEQEKRRLGET